MPKLHHRSSWQLGQPIPDSQFSVGYSDDLFRVHPQDYSPHRPHEWLSHHRLAPPPSSWIQPSWPPPASSYHLNPLDLSQNPHWPSASHPWSIRAWQSWLATCCCHRRKLFHFLSVGVGSHLICCFVVDHYYWKMFPHRCQASVGRSPTVYLSSSTPSGSARWQRTTFTASIRCDQIYYICY